MSDVLSALVMVGALMTPLALVTYGDDLWKAWQRHHTRSE